MILNTGTIEVSHSPELMKALVDLFSREDGPRAVIETGTYKGTGTTMALVKAWNIVASKEDFQIVTMEANTKYFNEAKRNLENWPFVLASQMLSVPRAEAIDYMRNNPIINGLKDYPDIFCDTNSGDHIGFYIKEMSPPVVARDIQQDGLRFYIDIFSVMEKKILFVLDSAGGIGGLEFFIMLDKMKGSSYFLWMDDINHVKHYLDLKYIENNEGWKKLFQDERSVIAEKVVN
jgi:hypothetical protein